MASFFKTVIQRFEDRRTFLHNGIITEGELLRNTDYELMIKMAAKLLKRPLKMKRRVRSSFRKLTALPFLIRPVLGYVASSFFNIDFGCFI